MDPPSGFTLKGIFVLPPELRLEIYRYLLLTSRTHPVYTTNYDNVHVRCGLEVSILRVNRRISAEAYDIFLDNKFVRITWPWPTVDTDFLPVMKCIMDWKIITKKPAFNFPHEAFLVVNAAVADSHCDITSFTTSFHSEHTACDFVLALEDLATFYSRSWPSLWSADVCYFFTLVNPSFPFQTFPKKADTSWRVPAVIGKALSPWRTMPKQCFTEKEWNFLTATEYTLMKARFHPLTSLRAASECEAQGEAADAAGCLEKAQQLYASAFRHLDILGVCESTMNPWLLSRILCEGCYHLEYADQLIYQALIDVCWRGIGCWARSKEHNKVCQAGKILACLDYHMKRAVVDDPRNRILPARIPKDMAHTMCDDAKALVYLGMSCTYGTIGKRIAAQESLMKARLYQPNESVRLRNSLEFKCRPGQETVSTSDFLRM